MRFLTGGDLWFLGLLAVALGTLAPVRAEDLAGPRPARATLSWIREPGAEECISAERLAKAMEEHLGYPAFAEGGELVVQGTVARLDAPTRFQAEVELRDREGTLLGRREVETPGSTCGVLDEALVLVLALAIDTQLVSLRAARTEPEPEPVMGPTADPEPSRPEQTPAPPTVPDPEPKPRATPSAGAESKPPPFAKTLRLKGAGSAFGLVLAVGSGFAVGLMPASAWNGSFTVGFRTPSQFGLELSGAFFPFGRVPTSEGEVNFRAGMAELRGCAPLVHGPVLVDGCLGLWNGVMRARASGFSLGNTARNAPLSGAMAQVRAAWEFYPRAFLRAGAGLGVPFVRDRFMAEGSEGTRVVLYRMSPVLALFELQAGMHFR